MVNAGDDFRCALDARVFQPPRHGARGQTVYADDVSYTRVMLTNEPEEVEETRKQRLVRCPSRSRKMEISRIVSVFTNNVVSVGIFTN